MSTVQQPLYQKAGLKNTAVAGDVLIKLKAQRTKAAPRVLLTFSYVRVLLKTFYEYEYFPVLLRRVHHPQ